MKDIQTNFKPMLAEGEKTEEHFLKILKQLDQTAYKIHGNYKYADLVSPKYSKKIELKHDAMSEKTGKFYFEYRCFGKESGIATSQADVWIIKSGQVYFLFYLNQIKRYLREHWLELKKATGGDDNDSCGVLLPIAEAERLGMQIDTEYPDTRELHIFLV